LLIKPAKTKYLFVPNTKVDSEDVRYTRSQQRVKTDISAKFYKQCFFFMDILLFKCECRDHDQLVVGFTTTNAISAYHH
jgi:hypothetical protein